MLKMDARRLSLIAFFSWSFTVVLAGAEEQKWSKESCKEIYSAIGIFVHLADEEWKKKQEEKGAFYASVAADYSNIYQTVCKKE